MSTPSRTVLWQAILNLEAALARVGGGGVTSVTGTAPIVSSGGAAPVISITPATDLAAGSLSASDKTKLDGISPGAAVATVSGAAPITSTGGTNPTIGITPATDLADGSLSAADKTKLDGIAPGAAVASVGATAPITSTGGATPNIGITPASDLAAGSLSAADKTKLDGITPGAAVASVTGTAPIASSGGANPDISISPATEFAAGSMSAADKTKLDGLSPVPSGGTSSSFDLTALASAYVVYPVDGPSPLTIGADTIAVTKSGTANESSTTFTPFVQPALGSNVTVAIPAMGTDSTFTAGAYVYHTAGGGFYLVVSVTAVSMTLESLGLALNGTYTVAPGGAVAGGSLLGCACIVNGVGLMFMPASSGDLFAGSDNAPYLKFRLVDIAPQYDGVKRTTLWAHITFPGPSVPAANYDSANFAWSFAAAPAATNVVQKKGFIAGNLVWYATSNAGGTNNGQQSSTPNYVPDSVARIDLINWTLLVTRRCNGLARGAAPGPASANWTTSLPRGYSWRHRRTFRLARGALFLRPRPIRCSWEPNEAEQGLLV